VRELIGILDFYDDSRFSADVQTDGARDEVIVISRPRDVEIAQVIVCGYTDAVSRGSECHATVLGDQHRPGTGIYQEFCLACRFVQAR
jgi:hypothetical protein